MRRVGVGAPQNALHERLQKGLVDDRGPVLGWVDVHDLRNFQVELVPVGADRAVHGCLVRGDTSKGRPHALAKVDAVGIARVKAQLVLRWFPAVELYVKAHLSPWRLE